MIVVRRARYGWTLAVLTAVLFCAHSLHAADPVFVVSPPVTHTLPASGGDRFELLISSTADVTKPFAALVHVRTPQGQFMAPDAVTLQELQGELTNGATYLKLAIRDVAPFATPGDYTVTIRLGGTVGSTVQTQLVSLTLQAPQPQLNADKLQNTTFRAWRSGPWASATVRETIKLEELSGRANLRDLQVSMQGVVLKGTTEASGTATVHFAGGPTPSGAAGTSGIQNALLANNQLPIVLTVTGLDRAGSHTTALLLKSPHLTSAIAVPLTIEVSDSMAAPLAVIAAGVLLGFSVRYLSQVAKPRQAARLRSTLLDGHLVRWRERTRDQNLTQKLDAIDQLLLKSADQLELGDIIGANATLDQADTALVEFANAWRERFTAVTTSLRATRNDLTEIRRQIPPDNTNALAQADLAGERLRAADAGVRDFDLPVAETHIAAAAGIVAAIERTLPPAGARKLAPGRRVERDVSIAVEPANPRIAGRELTLSVTDPDNVSSADSWYEWDFGDGSSATAHVTSIRHRYEKHGVYTIAVSVVSDAQVVQSAAETIVVSQRPIEQLAREQRKKAFWLQVALTAISMILAIFAGLWLLYFTKSFGSGAHYVEAFLWGFGIDSSVKSIADLLKKV